MKKVITALLIVGTTLILGCGGSTTPNVKTDKHKLVSGTHIFIVPPAGFSSNSMGYAKLNEKMPENDVLILVNEQQDESYSSALLKSKIAIEEMVGRGDKLLSKEAVQISGYEGELTTVSHTTGANSIILYFGNEKFYGWVIGSYNKNIEADGDEIKKAINTIVYEANPENSKS